MCGIIGYSGNSPECVKTLLEGLFALEYRGYDSSGVAVFGEDNKITVVKSAGRIKNTEEKLRSEHPSLEGRCGIGHTRWATHGAPTDENSHPHGNDFLRVVHNGIIENHAELKKILLGKGYVFTSATDTEAAALTIDMYCRGHDDRIEGIRKAISVMRGSYAFGIIFSDRPGVIYAARNESPLIIGLGDGANYLASDITAVLAHTKSFIRLENGETAEITKDSVRVFAPDGHEVEKSVSKADWSVEAARKGGYRFFMKKEIHEEPEALKKTLSPRIKNSLPDFSFDGFDASVFKDITRLRIVACGSAMHAGLIGKNFFERLAKLPVDVEIASEFRYGPLLCGKGDMVIVISQSGETADSLAALRAAKERGALTLGIVNVVGSSIARQADKTIYTMAGPEIAVATTKAFSVQCALLTLIAISAALARGTVSDEEAARLTSSLSGEAVEAVEKVLGRRSEIKKIAGRLYSSEHVFFIGRGLDSYICCEGSLKLKEISYIHSEAYPAGELKHGTISLVTDETPVVAVSTVPYLADKTASNIKEVMARGGRITYFGTEPEDASMEADFESSFILPELVSDEFYALPIATAVQLLAYYTTELKGFDVDKPRNLAKSVTVE